LKAPKTGGFRGFIRLFQHSANGRYFTELLFSDIFQVLNGDEARLGVIPEKPISGTIASTSVLVEAFY
jgi:hypothetical protein